MATKKGGKCKRRYYQAKLVTNVGTCVFCRRAVDDEIIYGKLYAIGDIQCHYFCALLSCCLMQKGSDEEGLFGFLYPDILAEVERSKKHRCSYCSREGASLGCSVAQCRKQFHLPCGRERDAVSLFFGNYKSFCALHAPKQKILDSIMPNVKMRIAVQRQKLTRRPQKPGSMDLGGNCEEVNPADKEVLCVICYEQVEGFPTPKTFWPPCCARDAWFHRSCLQRMALSAGMHYLKCPLCNDKEQFYKAVVSQGYYVPDRDAAWELEQNAFAEIYERPIACSAETCKCTKGRDYDSDSGPWDIKLCILCGSTAIHAGCMDSTDEQTNIYICTICKPAAPCDLEALIASIEKVQLQEQPPESQVRHGPVMPSRMSIRRTKPIHNSRPGSSRNLIRTESMTNSDDTKKTEASRLELNLKKPVRRIFEPTGKNIENILLSPIKILEQGFSEKMGQLNDDVVVDSSKVLEKLRDKLKKPRPLVVKKRIIDNILDELFTSILHDPKSKEALKEWNSPKKMCDITADEEKEIIEDLTPTKTNKEETPLNDKVTPKSKPVKEISLQYINIANEKDVCEVNEFKCSFRHKHIDKTPDGSKLRTAIDFAIDAYKENKRKMPNEETIPLKKRKFNCSLKRKERDSVEKNDLETKKGDLDEEKASTEFRKQDETKEVWEECKKDGDTDYNKIIVADTVLKDTVPKDKGIVVSYSLTRNRKKSVEKETKVETEGSETYRKINNKEQEEMKESEDVASLREETEKNNIEIDERSTVDKVLQQKDSVSKKKKLSLKKRPLKKLVNKAIDLKSKNKPVFTDTKSMKIEDLTESKEDIVECNKDILKDGKDENIPDNEKKIKRGKERNHSSKNKKKGDRRHKRTNKGKHFNDLKSEKDIIDFTLDDIDKKLKLKYKNKQKKMSIQNKNIKVKIKWKKEHFKLKITGKKEKKEKKKRILEDNSPKVFKQYVLKYSPEVISPQEMIMKPTNSVTPPKRKYIKMEKHEDNMIQTNISSFFKATPKAN